MLWLYIAALIVGAGVMLVQALGDHDTHDGDHDVDSLILSPRFWTFLALAFGISGTLLTLFQLASTLAVLIIAGASGLASGLLAAFVIRALKRGEISTVPSAHEAIGRVGEVLIPCEKGRVGKVRVALRGQTIDLLAMAGDATVATGTRVVVEDIEGGVARVTRAPDEIS